MRENFSVLVMLWTAVDNYRLREAALPTFLDCASAGAALVSRDGGVVAEGVASTGRRFSLRPSWFHLFGVSRVKPRSSGAICSDDDDWPGPARPLRIRLLPRLQSLWRADPRHPGACSPVEVVAGRQASPTLPGSPRLSGGAFTARLPSRPVRPDPDAHGADCGR